MVSEKRSQQLIHLLQRLAYLLLLLEIPFLYGCQGQKKEQLPAPQITIKSISEQDVLWTDLILFCDGIAITSGYVDVSGLGTYERPAYVDIRGLRLGWPKQSHQQDEENDNANQVNYYQEVLDRIVAILAQNPACKITFVTPVINGLVSVRERETIEIVLDYIKGRLQGFFDETFCYNIICKITDPGTINKACVTRTFASFAKQPACIEIHLLSTLVRGESTSNILASQPDELQLIALEPGKLLATQPSKKKIKTTWWKKFNWNKHQETAIGVTWRTENHFYVSFANYKPGTQQQKNNGLLIQQ